MPYAAHFLNAFLLCIVLVMWLRPLALPSGLVDHPTERKAHAGLVPLIGGLAMFVAFVLAWMLLGSKLDVHGGLLVGLFVLVVVGVVDDLRDLRPMKKLVVQCGAALAMMVPGGHVLDLLGELAGIGTIRLGPLGWPISLLFVVGMINAVNMIDGVDGLAGGVVAAVLFWLSLIAAATGHHEEVLIILLLFFATLGFLVFNFRSPWRRTAEVFMGNAGSMMLGASVAYFVVVLAAESSVAPSPHRGALLPALLWPLALPVIDTLSLIVRRLLAGVSPFAADRRHLHHLLLEAGLTPQQVTVLLVLVAFALGGVGFAGFALAVSDAALAAGLLLPLAAHIAFVRSRSGRRPQARPTQAAVAAKRLDTADGSAE